MAKPLMMLAALVAALAWCSAALAEPAEKPEGASAAAKGAKEVEELDNGHKNATAAMTALEEVRFDLSIFTLVVFLLLMAILWKFAWGPIAKGLDAREASIAKMIEEAKVASEAAAKQQQQFELRLTQAQEEAGKVIADARRQAESIAAKIKSDAENAAQKEKDRAVAEIESAKNQALREIAQKSVTTAVDLARKIIQREVRESDHQQLIAESLNRFSSN